MATVRVRLIGCGDAFSSGGRLQTTIHLEGAGEPLMMDCGATVLAGLKREGIDPGSIGWVALSHLHGDHFAGIPWLIMDGRFSGRTEPLVVAGPPDLEQRVKQAFEALYPGSFGAERPFELRFVELTMGWTEELGSATVTPYEALHQSGSSSYSLRVSYGGKVIAYSGDTEWSNNLLDAARGADLFICECNFFDEQVPGHLNYKTLIAKRDQMDCARLLLTHMSEDMLGRVKELDVETAHDGMLVEI